MAEIKGVSTTNKTLVIVAGIESILIVILFLSGFKKLNPYLLGIGMMLLAIAILYYLKKPKQQDIYQMLDNLQLQHYRKLRKFLDITDAQATQLTPEIVEIFLPNEGMTFEIRGKLIKGMQYRHLYKVVSEQEKSTLLKESIKHLGAQAVIRQQAELSGIDPEKLGLE